MGAAGRGGGEGRSVVVARGRTRGERDEDEASAEGWAGAARRRLRRRRDATPTARVAEDARGRETPRAFARRSRAVARTSARRPQTLAWWSGARFVWARGRGREGLAGGGRNAPSPSSSSSSSSSSSETSSSSTSCARERCGGGGRARRSATERRVTVEKQTLTSETFRKTGSRRRSATRDDARGGAHLDGGLVLLGSGHYVQVDECVARSTRGVKGDARRSIFVYDGISARAEADFLSVKVERTETET